MLMGELATLVKYGLDVKVIVVKNNTLGQIKWEQRYSKAIPNSAWICNLSISPGSP
jgi:pyruvate dehydrogenase (quinone)